MKSKTSQNGNFGTLDKGAISAQLNIQTLNLIDGIFDSNLFSRVPGKAISNQLYKCRRQCIAGTQSHQSLAYLLCDHVFLYFDEVN